MSKARLRTKSGCLTCRRRKVKCGEERDICSNCSSVGRECEWPGKDSMVDGRSRRRSLQRRRSSSLSEIGSVDKCFDIDFELEVAQSVRTDKVPAWAMPMMSPLRTISVPCSIRSNLDNELVIHYRNSLHVMLLSTAHHGFFDDYLEHIMRVGMSDEGVMDSILAWSASNKYLRGDDARYREAALSYYSRTVSSVKTGLAKLEAAGERRLDDSMMLMVEYLYLHALWGADASVDARKHVAGAMNLLNLRYGHAKDMVRPFDRVSVESVLYQAFLLHMRSPFSPNFHVSNEFLQQTELLLDYLGFEDASVADNTPVLALPIELYRLILDIITCFGCDSRGAHLDLADLRSRVRSWESCLGNSDESDDECPFAGNPHSWVIRLYILTTSLLMSLMLLHHSDVTFDRHDSQHSTLQAHWQARQIIEMFGDPLAYATWTKCYIILWPVLILGYAIRKDEEVVFVRQMMDDMLHSMGYGEVQRVREELNVVWARNFPSTGQRADGHLICPSINQQQMVPR